MKRTELERIEREYKRSVKKNQGLQRQEKEHSVNSYITKLYSIFRYDQNEIFNINEDLEILEVLEDMHSHLPEKKWIDVLRKSVKKTGVANKDQAIRQLEDLLPKKSH